MKRRPPPPREEVPADSKPIITAVSALGPDAPEEPLVDDEEYAKIVRAVRKVSADNAAERKRRQEIRDMFPHR